MKKTLILLLTLAFLPILGKSIGAYKTGDELYVWAVSGLNLREKPAQEAAKLSNIPYGSKVKVIGTSLKQIAFQVNEFTGFTIKGFWVEIQFGNQRGFVFDGFLSKISPPTKEEKYMEFEYFKRVFTQKSTSTTPPKGTMTIPNTYEYHLYTNGLSGDSYQFEGGVTSGITIPVTLMSLEEVYLLAKLLYKEDTGVYKNDYKASPLSIIITSKDELNQIEIVKKGTYYTVTFSVAD
jgi:hypothetical protein